MSRLPTPKSLVEKGLLLCGYGGMFISLLVGLFIMPATLFMADAEGAVISLILAALGFAAGIGLLSLAEIIKYLKIIASASVSETFK